MEGVYGGCSGLTSTAFTLPAGYRPAALMQFLTLGEGGVAGVDGFEVGVKVSGEVYCAAGICFLNGITFRAES